ncbi:hypothetical protein PYCCODRAFT_1399737 [Trametes coccinea BRFM310]|uniref:BTB domain-containing protein n=1 Tax=Trametes coccinea (strain BRFM310) TaxID=1353009 RepID=A0A1Y2I6P5_TRAC3|nr:hypothetical protein PYCCODRAFT_1399737 [Trametes coccinea BRFM310]
MMRDDCSMLTSPESLKDLAGALPSPPVSPPAPVRDSEFYCRDIVFLVEGVLFKVSRRPFEDESNAFGSTFKLPAENGPLHAEGSSDAHPLPLLGVSAEEFRALLCVLFPLSYGARRSLTKEQWLSALKLADMWHFDEVRAKAVDELRRLVPRHAERVHLARVYRISGWVEPALKELVKQDALSADDLQFLGWGTAAKLLEIRENVIFRESCACSCNYCTHAHGALSHSAHALAGYRPATVTAASLRRSTDFSTHIREVFVEGVDLF